MNVHQMLPNFSAGDAIGDDTLALQRILRGMGHASDIYAGVIHPYLVDRAYHWKKYPEHPDNLLIYHFSVGSEIADYIVRIPDRLVLVFHNITPARWFFGFSPHMTELAAEGLAQLKMLKDRTTAVWADSDYNGKILQDLGFENIHVLPVILDFNRLDLDPNPVVGTQFDSSQVTWFFAGRVSPNKCHEDIIKAFSVYRNHINQHSRLLLVGDVRNCHRYADSLNELVKRLGIPDVIFTGMIDDDEWVSLFRMADVFVCMSEHEGFCVPLLEAMYFDVPVIAYDAGAVAGTLGGSGVLVRTKDPLVIAETADLLIRDRQFRDRILQGQRRRLKEYRESDYFSAVARLLGIIK
ncbi:glycosyltransferase [bacterium]|nr:glycosyltransferase [candidate division CSSED10-310 bacterium]